MSIKYSITFERQDIIVISVQRVYEKKNKNLHNEIAHFYGTNEFVIFIMLFSVFSF